MHNTVMGTTCKVLCLDRYISFWFCWFPFNLIQFIKYLAKQWPVLGYHMHTTCVSHAHHLPITCIPHGYHKHTTWVSNAHHIGITYKGLCLDSYLSFWFGWFPINLIQPIKQFAIQWSVLLHLGMFFRRKSISDLLTFQLIEFKYEIDCCISYRSLGMLQATIWKCHRVFYCTPPTYYMHTTWVSQAHHMGIKCTPHRYYIQRIMPRQLPFFLIWLVSHQSYPAHQTVCHTMVCSFAPWDVLQEEVDFWPLDLSTYRVQIWDWLLHLLQKLGYAPGYDLKMSSCFLLSSHCKRRINKDHIYT